MSSQAQIKANRQNAQKSTGPKTPEGKAAVSQNAIKHGLLSHRNIISSESQAEFDLHRDQFLQELNPETAIQSFIADRIVSLSWRLKRAEIIQNQAMDYLDERNDKSPIVKMTQAMLLKLYPVPEDDDDDPPLNIPLGKMAVKDYNNARVLDRLLMYERRLESSLHKSMQEYQRLKLINNIDTEQQSPPDKLNMRNEPNLSKRPVHRSLSSAKMEPNLQKTINQQRTMNNQQFTNKPNLVLSEVEGSNVTNYPTSNYGKFNRLQKPENQPKLALNGLGEGEFEEGPIPFLPAKLTDQDCLPYVALAKEGARWKAFKKK